MKKLKKPVHGDYSHHPVLNRLYPVLLRQARAFIGEVDVDIVVELLRQAWVEEAAHQVFEERGKVIYSRVALLAGVRTNCIPHLQSPALFDSDTPLIGVAKLIHAWMNEEAYRDAESGEPATLLIHGTGATFERLTGSVLGRGVTAQTALDELSASGAVAVKNIHWVQLLNHHSVLERGKEYQQTQYDVSHVAG